MDAVLIGLLIFAGVSTLMTLFFCWREYVTGKWVWLDMCEYGLGAMSLAGILLVIYGLFHLVNLAVS